MYSTENAQDMPTFVTVGSNRRPGSSPFFSICIPQYNRTDFLLAACETYQAQSFRDFELCISDDCSNDGKESKLRSYLAESSLSYVYAQTARNLRYDGNLRNAIALSSGRYLVLMGNDDGFADVNVLSVLHEEIIRHGCVAVAITNYREISTNTVYRRMIETGAISGGPRTAVMAFRRFSFVSGVVLDGERARKASTDTCDGTEMYQMYLGSRLIASGGSLLSIDRVCVNKDLQIDGQVVDSYRTRRTPSFPISERSLPMTQLFRVVASATEPFHNGAERERNLINVANQLYRFIYPFWVIEYRRTHSWGYSLGVLLAVRPNRLTKSFNLGALSMLRLWATYTMNAIGSLLVPIDLFDRLRPFLYSLAKRNWSRKGVESA